VERGSGVGGWWSVVPERAAGWCGGCRRQGQQSMSVLWLAGVWLDVIHLSWAYDALRQGRKGTASVLVGSSLLKQLHGNCPG
jgi:hypothetical protein